MSKYEIIRQCGHTETVQITGPVKDRDSKAQYESGKLCYECYKAKQAKERAAESFKAAEEAKASGLPALVGSEKQVAWAEAIRANAAKALSELKAKMADVPTEKRQIAAIAIDIIDRVLARTSAHDWIEAKDTQYSLHWLAAETKKAMEAK